MRKRYEAARALLPEIYLRPGHALREVWAEGYGLEKLRTDVLAGLVVGIVALPLSMALAIASGVPPQQGLYTAIIAGGAIAVLGGSRTQVSGPTAAFVVILAPIAGTYGLGGLCVATVLAGIFLVGLGAFRLGKLIQFIPYPVTTGFTAGIGVVIGTLQVKDLLGLQVEHMPDHYIERVVALGGALGTVHFSDLSVGLATLAILIVLPRYTKKIPAPLVALAFAGVAAAVAHLFFPAFSVDTIGDRFSYTVDGVVHAGIPRLPPMPVLPWNLAGPDGAPVGLSLGMIRALLPSAFAIALLGAIESLLSAVVADGMTQTRHNPDAELVAQGCGNILAPFFGGIAATGAIARTATAIRAGSRSPVAAIVHAIFVLLAVVGLSPVLGYLPMAALAALLMVVAWNMSEAPHFIHVARVAPKSDVAVLLVCFGLTVFFDMVVGVSVGVVLAALLFMRRMAEFSGAKLTEGVTHGQSQPLPPGVIFYSIAGPLFFGAAQKAMDVLGTVGGKVRVVILDMEDVPVMDATGLVNLESAIARLHSVGALVLLSGVQGQPSKLLARAGIPGKDERTLLVPDVGTAVMIARTEIGVIVAPPDEPAAPPMGTAMAAR